MSLIGDHNKDFAFELEFIADLEIAIKNVSAHYCKWGYNGNVQKNERVFAYQLYHQISKIKDNNAAYRNLRIDAEIGKSVYDNPIDSCSSTFEVTNNNRFEPDLILHKSQDSDLQENQKYIIEIKRQAPDIEELCKTVIKLNHYIKFLNYQFAVFLIVNADIRKITADLKANFEDEVRPDFKEIFERILIYTYSNEQLNLVTLADSINEN